MNMNFTPPPAANSELAVVAALLEAVTDPAKHKARLAELTKLVTDRNAVLTAANDAIKKLQDESTKTKIEVDHARQAAAAEVQRLRTQLDVDAAAIAKRAEANDKRVAELDAREKKLAEREAAISKREATFREAAAQIRA